MIGLPFSGDMSFCDWPPRGSSFIKAHRHTRIFFISAYMASLMDSTAKAASRRRSVFAFSGLVARDREAPIAELSASKKHALVSCLNAGGLKKKHGAWHGAQGGMPISGITTADLARDGLLILAVRDRKGSAQLTERGNWFARTLLSNSTPPSRNK